MAEARAKSKFQIASLWKVCVFCYIQKARISTFYAIVGITGLLRHRIILFFIIFGLRSFQQQQN